MNEQRTVLVTGATGFIGHELVQLLVRRGFCVRCASRRPIDPSTHVKGCDHVVVEDLRDPTRWAQVLQGIDCVVHLAGRAHSFGKGERDRREHWMVNTLGTATVAEAARESGVKRFVYVSSIKVHGDSDQGKPISPNDPPAPNDPYGRSKLEAEKVIWNTTQNSPIEAVVVRPPLVYGPGVKGNFLHLLRSVSRGYPLPVGAVKATRSFISSGNLADLLTHSINCAAASGRVLLPSDGEDIAIPDLVQRIGRAMGCRVRLVPVPCSAIRLAAWILGQPAKASSLCASMTVDSSCTRAALSWRPPHSVDDELVRTVRWFESLEE